MSTVIVSDRHPLLQGTTKNPDLIRLTGLWVREKDGLQNLTGNLRVAQLRALIEGRDDEAVIRFVAFENGYKRSATDTDFIAYADLALPVAGARLNRPAVNPEARPKLAEGTDPQAQPSAGGEANGANGDSEVPF